MLCAAVLCLLLTLSSVVSECWGPGEFEECTRIGCEHASGALGFESYPLTTEMLRRSVPYEGDTARLHDIIRRSVAGDPLHVVVVGGSITLGHFCRQGNFIDGDCAWTSRIKVWLEKRFPKSQINVDVRAHSGCASVCQLSPLSQTLPADDKIDIVLVDLSVNDSAYGQAAELLKSSFKPLSSYHGYDVNVGAVEAIARRAVGLKSKPAVIYMQSFQINDYIGSWNVQDWYRTIVQPYGAHTVSYRDAVWPVYEERSAELSNIFWAPGTERGDGDGMGIHPGWRSHQLYADMLAHFFDNAYVAVCEKDKGHATPTITAQEVFIPATGKPLKPTTELIESMLCSGSPPSTLYDAEVESTHSTVTTRAYVPVGSCASPPCGYIDGGWSLFSDRKGKPGFIGYGLTTPHAVAEFKIKCRIPKPPETAWLAVTYLKSYNSMGAVRVFGRNPKNETHFAESPASQGTVIDGLDTSSKMSVYVTRYIEMDESFYSPTTRSASLTDVTVSFALLAPDDENFHRKGENVPRVAWKFKIVRLSCC